MSRLDAYANGHIFITGEFDVNFPVTVFHGAFFDLLVNGTTVNNGSYSWSISGGISSAITVSDMGRVTVTPFIDYCFGEEFTITAKNKKTSEVLEYKFAPKIYFHDAFVDRVDSWGNAKNTVESNGYIFPAIEYLVGENKSTRLVGPSLWPEWGNWHTLFPGDKDSYYWSANVIDDNTAYAAYLNNDGYKESMPKSNFLKVIGMRKSS